MKVIRLVINMLISLCLLSSVSYAQETTKIIARAQEWNTFRGTTSRTGFNASEMGLKPPLKNKWIALQGNPNLPDVNMIIESSPLIAGNKVYVATLFDTKGPSVYNSSIVALDLSGRIVWSTPLGMSGIWSTPVINKEKLYVGAWDGYFYALDTTDGHILWQTYLSGQSRAYRASPVVVDNSLFVGTYEDPMSYLHVLDLTSGAIKSSIALPGKLYSSPVMVSANRVAIVISKGDGNSLLQVYQTRGEDNPFLVWERTLDGDSWSTPLVINGKIVHRTGNWQSNPSQGQSYLYVVDAATGQLAAATYVIAGAGYWSSPATDGQRIYVTLDKNRLAGISLAKLLSSDVNPIDWTFIPPDGGPIAASPAVANGYVYFGTDDLGNPEGAFYALKASTGEQVWEYHADGGVGSAQSSPAISNGMVIFVSYDDNDGIENGVHAFQSIKTRE